MYISYVKATLCASAVFIVASVAIAQGLDAETEPGRISELPEGYRSFELISVAHEAGSLNDIRAILGNDIAMSAYRSGKRPFPDGSVIVRLAYKYVSSEQNNEVFGQQQSFIAGDPTNIQVDAKDSKKWPTTGGWGFGQFVNGKSDPNSQSVQTCFACHNRLDSPRDLVFTNYAP
ncbi:MULTISPECIES: cytochrome P460 family protein [Methylobacterium]|nr:MULTISPECIES: cytochrome P460 family protein [Methylobacterium]TXN23954.1 cytochrome P460 [Methylobacterium sp. WL9]